MAPDVPPRLRPKAARLLGLASPNGSDQCEEAPECSARRSFGSISDGGDEDDSSGQAGSDHVLLLTPVSLRSVDSSESRVRSGTTWVPDWPEPDDEYVEAMMQRRPVVWYPGRDACRTVGRAGIDDPLTVWHQPAVLPRMAGIPPDATNAWRRRHGLQWPLDPLLVAQWMVALTLSAGYAAFVRPLSVLALADNAANPVLRVLDVIGTVSIVAALALSLATSAVDPQAPETLARDVPRNLYFQQQWGAPAIDPLTRTCRVCCVATKPGTRHCKRCNKCVAHLDHHCRYLGTCIGSRNYPWFFASVCTAAVALLSVLARAVHMVYVSGWQKAQFIELVYRLTNTPLAPTDLNGGLRAPIAMCALAIYACLAAVSVGLIAMLLAFHVRLWLLSTTTIEYEAAAERNTEMHAATLDDMIPMEDVRPNSYSTAIHAPEDGSQTPELVHRARTVSRKAAKAMWLFVARKLRRHALYRPVSTRDHQMV